MLPTRPVTGQAGRNNLGDTQGNGDEQHGPLGQKRGLKMSVTDQGSPTLAVDELDALDAWWRAANYLSVGQI
jgi:hypothetical protein